MRSTGGGVPGSRSPSKKGGSVGRAISSTAKGKRADFGRPKKVRVSPKVARALSGTANVKRGRVKTKPGRPVQSGGKVGTVRAGRRNEGPDLASAIQTINRLRGVSDRPGVKPPTPVLDAAWKGLKEYQSASQTQKRVLKGFPQVDTEKLVKSDLAGKTVTINGKKRKLKTLGASGSEAAGKALKGVLIPKQAATFGPQKDIQEATKRVARDVIDTTVNTPATVYELGKAGVKAAGGDLGPAKKLAKQATTEDPIGRLVAKGDPSKIVEHPGIAFMEAWGIGHGGGRAAGAAMRRGPKKLRKYASVKREDARVSGTNIREKREYSRNIVANRVQKSRARKGAKKARDLRAEAKRVEKDNPTAAVELRNQANKVDPNEMMGGRAFGDPVRRRVYEESAANTNVARTRRLRNRKAAMPVEKDMSGASADVIQGVVRTKADLEDRIARLEAQTKDLSPGERVLQDRQLKSLRKALKDFDPKREADVARRYAELSHPAEQRLVDLGLLGEGQSAEAASIPFRVDRMGAEFTKTARKKLLRRAKGRVRRATMNARVAAARQQVTPELKAARAEERAAQSEAASLSRKRVSVARRQGRAAVVAERAVRKADRQVLRQDEQYAAIEKELAAANREKGKARRQWVRAKKRGTGYKLKEVYDARDRVRAAEGQSASLASDLKAREAQLRQHGELAVRKVAGREWKPGQAWGAERLDRRPTGALGSLERRQADEALLETQVREARGRVRRAEGRVAAEKKRTRGVPRKQYEALINALNDVADAKALPKEDYFADSKGRVVSQADAEKAMKAAGVDPKSVSFITHREGSAGAGSNYRASERANTLPSQRRTGESFKKGLYDNSPEAVVDSYMRAQTLADAVEGWNRNVDALAARESKSGRVVSEQTHAKAAKRAKDLSAKTGRDFVPVRLQAFGARGEELSRLLENTGPDELLRGETLVEYLKGFTDESKPGPWTVMPVEAADGLTQVLNGLGGTTAEKVLQKFSQLFRRNVLPTRPTWLAGNLVEGTVRTAVLRATPADYKRFRAVLERLRKVDPVAAEQLEARVLGGGNVGGVTSRMPRRGRDQFKGTRFEGLADDLGRFWDLKAPKASADAWHTLTDKVIDGSRAAEQQFQMAMAGKYLRQKGLFEDPVGFRRISDKAIQQAAEGLRNTDEQVAMGRYVDEAYGKYDKFSPSARRWIITYTPFGAWYRNAFVFLFKTLPLDHPVLLAVMANAAMVTREERAKYGMAFGESNALADFLQGSVPVGGGKYVRISRYGPSGALIDFPASGAQQVLPQFSGFLAALRGQDPFGNEVQDLKDNPAGRLLEGGKQLAGGFVPLVGPAQEIAKKKGEYFNPFPPTKGDPGKAEWFRLLDKRKTKDLTAGEKARLKVLDKKYRKKKVKRSSSGGGWGGGGSGGGWGSG